MGKKLHFNTKHLLILSVAALFLFCTTAVVNAALVNVAIGKSASQSSTFDGGVAGRAIDGSTDGVWANGSVTHTSPWPEGNPPNVYWQVDLGGIYSIDQIVIWNRTDSSYTRLTNFYVAIETSTQEVWRESFYTEIIEGTGFPGYPNPSLTIDLSAYNYSGSIVRIGYNTTGPRGNDTYPWVMNLAEVEVKSDIGSPVPIPGALWLLGSGLVGLIGIRRKGNKKG